MPEQINIAPTEESLFSQQLTDIADSTTTHLKADTIQMIVEVPFHAPIPKEGTIRKQTISDSSFVISFLLLLFVIVCFRYRKNFRYIKSLFKELTDVRQRNNIFDDTIRESSFLFLLNLTYITSISIIFHCSLLNCFPEFSNIPILISFGICFGISILFVLWQLTMYYFTGNIFYDHNSTSLWIKGARASQALAGVILFPFAMISIFYPEWGQTLIIISIIISLLAKFAFIFKGFRIFFTQSSSLMIFLYYLCTIEIIPIIFSILGAIEICKLFI